MTHITQEAQTARASHREGRAAVRDTIINSIFNPYTFLCLILVIGGVSLVGMDAKGVPLLVLALVMAAIIRLLWTIREELREANSNQAQSNTLLRASLRGSDLHQ